MPAISGATGTTFTLTSAQVGKTVYVVETATNPGGVLATQSASVGPISGPVDPGEALLQSFEVWLNGATDLVPGATGTVTPTNGGVINIGTLAATAGTDPTISATSITGDGVDDFMVFNDANIPELGTSDLFTVVLAMKAPTKATDFKRAFFNTGNGSPTGNGLTLSNESGATNRIIGQLKGAATNTIFGSTLPNIYTGAMWVIVAQVNSSTFKVQAHNGTTLSTESVARTSGDATQIVPPRLFGESRPAPAEMFAAAYTQANFTDAEVGQIAAYLFSIHNV